MGVDKDVLHVFEIVMADAPEKVAKAELQTWLSDHTIDKKILMTVSVNNRETTRKCTPMHVACALGKLELVKCLCVKGYDVNARDEAQRLPFHYACRHGRLGVVEWIMNTVHADQKFVDSTTKMSLQELLLATGSDFDTGFELAFIAGHTDVVEAFEQYEMTIGCMPVTSKGTLSQSLVGQ